MPMVENDEITGTMRGDGENDPVSEFIGTFFVISGFWGQLKFIFVCFSVLQSELHPSDLRRLREDSDIVLYVLEAIKRVSFFFLEKF